MPVASVLVGSEALHAQDLSVYYAADFGILADGNDHGAALNALLVQWSAAGGAHVILPAGWIRTSVPIVMQSSIWLDGAGPQAGPLAAGIGQGSGILLLASANCDVLDYQCYVPAATAWTTATAYSANAMVTAPGPGGASWYYFANRSIASSVTAAPLGDLWNWTAFSPVPAGTQQASVTKVSNLQLNGNKGAQGYGDFHHGHNFSATATDPTPIIENVWSRLNTGDSFHTTSGGTLISNTARYLNCYGATSQGSAIIPGFDSEVTSCHFGYHGLGGMLLQRNSVRVTSTKIYNNGYVPAFMAENTSGTGSGTLANGGGTTAAHPITVASLSLTSDMIGQGIFDGTGTVPGQGSIPAGTYIFDVLSTTTLLLSQSLTADLTAGTELHIGGYYFANLDPKCPTACIGVSDGNLYTLKVASVSGLAAGAAPGLGSPAGSGTVNWQPIRTAYEWGWDYMVQGASVEEVAISSSTSQGCPRGTFGLQSTNGANNIQGTGSRWQSNPRTGSPLITVPQAVTNLLGSAFCGISAASDNIIALSSSLAGSGGAWTAPGALLNFVSGTGNTITIVAGSTDFTTTTVGGTQAIPASNIVTVNGVAWGQAAVQPETLYLGPAGGTSGFCLAETSSRFASFNAVITMTTGLIKASAVYIPAGVSITKLGWITGTTAATTPTHQWLALFDSSYNMLCNTADVTTAAVSASTTYQYSVAGIASGAASAFVTAYSGLYYLGILEAASVTVATANGPSVNTVGLFATAPVPAVVQVGSPLSGVPAYPYTITGATSTGLASAPYVWAS